MATTDLAAWLLERIAEDEKLAREVGDDVGSTSWTQRGPTIETVNGGDVADFVATEACWHIERWDPARALAECEANRRIVELHKPSTETSAAVACIECGPCPDCAWDAESSWPCGTLRLLALPYADRPGYLDEWRPEHGETPPPSRGQGNWTT